MTEENNNEDIAITEEDLLSQLEEVDLSEVEEVRQTVLPVGTYIFRINDMRPQVFGEYPVIVKELQVESVVTLRDPNLDEEKYVGATHMDSVFLTDMDEGLGRVKAFLKDIGAASEGPILELMDAAVGKTFIANVKHTKSKKDPDTVFVNLNKVRPTEDE